MVRRGYIVIGLAGLVASIVLWIATYAGYSWKSDNRRMILLLTPGLISMSILTPPICESNENGRSTYSGPPANDNAPVDLTERHFVCSRPPNSRPSVHSVVFLLDAHLHSRCFPSAQGGAIHLPPYLFVLVFGALSLHGSLPVYRARRRLRCGLCTSCGYDLRASEVRCPECGQPIGWLIPDRPAHSQM